MVSPRQDEGMDGMAVHYMGSLALGAGEARFARRYMHLPTSMSPGCGGEVEKGWYDNEGRDEVPEGSGRPRACRLLWRSAGLWHGRTASGRGPAEPGGGVGGIIADCRIGSGVTH